jgi:DNA-binding response OmpR family regulator
MSKCPCCGGNIANRDKPLISLDTNRLMCGGEIYQLSAREAEIISILVDSMPLPVHTDRIISRLYGGQSTEAAYNTLKVFIFKLRQKIQDSTIKIVTIHGRGHALEYKRAA